jgi:hypothetical protein
MINLAEIFQIECKQAFHFLENNYNFKLKKVKNSVYSTCILYQNSTTAVEICFEKRELQVLVLLMKLINGEIPKYPMFIQPDTVINSFYLDDLMALNAVDIEQKEWGYELTAEDLKETITKYAHYLKEFGKDVLRGDFKIFVELEKKVKERVKNET